MKLQDHPISEKFDYPTYMALIENLVANGKTSGPNQTEALVHYTKLNLKRMQRLNKTTQPSTEVIEALKNIPFNMHWVAITETWCGDAAQNLPYIAKLAALSPNVDISFLLRDENIALMDQFLTNGSRSIPKVIICNNEGDVLATWGPRPAEMQGKVMAYKSSPGPKPPFDQFALEIHQWYTANKNVALESELLATFRRITELTVAN